MTSKPPLTGLNLYRALAIVLMIIAHSSRLQTNLTEITMMPAKAGIFDHVILWVLKFEPIISAMFLFIAGFSLVLSHTQSAEPPKQWLLRQIKRAGQLYLIAVVFYLGDLGIQMPDTLVSPGILSVIAVALLGAALCLVLPYRWQALAGISVVGLVMTAVLEQTRTSIPGLNAGAGGMFPLVVIAWLGALTGLIRQRWPQQGLQLLTGGSLLVALLALSTPYPWVTHPTTTLHFYPGDHVQAVLFSLQDMVGAYNGQAQVRNTAYWNHSSIFALRALPLLVLMLLIFLKVFKSARHPVTGFCNWMGSQALNLYILHLLLLAPLELSGLKPSSGWQTLAITAAIIALSPWILRYLSFIPWRLGRSQVP
jgi:hypothetical protein